MATKIDYIYVLVGFTTILGVYLLFRQIALREGFFDRYHSGHHASYHSGGVPGYHTRYGGGYNGGSSGWPWYYWEAPVVLASICGPNQIAKRDLDGTIVCIPTPTYVIL